MSSVTRSPFEDQPGLSLLLDTIARNRPSGTAFDSPEWERYWEDQDTLINLAQADLHPGYDEADGPELVIDHDDPWVHCLAESWVEWNKRGESRRRELEQLRDKGYEVVARKIERGELPRSCENPAAWDFVDPWDAELVFTALDHYRATQVEASVSDQEIEELVARWYGSPAFKVA